MNRFPTKFGIGIRDHCSIVATVVKNLISVKETHNNIEISLEFSFLSEN